MQRQNNYAFIDGNNLVLGLRDQGWQIDYQKFHRYLKDKYRIKKAFWFIGYLSKNKKIYANIQRAGFELVLKKTVTDKFGNTKGNVDVLLTVKCFEYEQNFDGIVLVSGDGDFVDLLKAMQKKDKQIKIIVPNAKRFSCLLNVYEKSCCFLSYPNLKKKLSYQKNG